MHTSQHGIQQASQIAQQLIQQTQQSNQQYRQMLQQEQQNVHMLEQMLQREKQAAQFIEQSLHGHEQAIQRCQEVINICNSIQHELTGSQSFGQGFQTTMHQQQPTNQFQYQQSHQQPTHINNQFPYNQ